MTLSAEYRRRIAEAFAQLGIDPATATARGLSICEEPPVLVVAQVDTNRREHRLTPAAAVAWQAMRNAAAAEGIAIHLVSAFRSFDRQVELLRQKLAAGISWEQALTVSAPPGYSEHHSGCAIDLGIPGCPPLEEEFEQTGAFAWLRRRAAEFGFTLSYPRGNAQGYAYEPWHWCWRPTDVGLRWAAGPPLHHDK